MQSLVCVMGGSLLSGLVLIPVARGLALRVGLVDQPDGRRKIHGQPIPVSGGLAVFVAVWSVLGGALLLPHPLRDALRAESDLLLGLFISSCILVAVGVVDDCGRLRGRYKLLAQLVAVAIVMMAGVHVQHVHAFGWRIDLGPLSWPFTCIMLVTAINSINLLDGMDGLLGSLGCWLSLALACMAALSGQWWGVLPAVALAGALLAFLCFNLPPARIFMGDAGSMLVGLLLGTLAIQMSLKAVATVTLLLPLGLLALPFFDTGAAILRRKLTGRSIYTTDRGHLHHCLLKKGFSIRHTLVVVSLFCLLSCAGVLAGMTFNNDWIVLLSMVTVVGTLILTRLFGHTEAMLVKERIMAAFRRAAPSRQMQVRLQGTSDWRPLWGLLTELADSLNLQRLHLDVNAPALHEGYYARWDRAEEGGPEESVLWRASIPFTAQGQVIGRLDIAGRPDDAPVWEKIAALVQVVDVFLQAAVPEAPVLQDPEPARPACVPLVDRVIVESCQALSAPSL